MLNVDPVTNDNEVGVERFEAVALLHMQELYRTAVAILRDGNQAEDIVQETYLRAWKAFSSFTPGTNCRAWLFKILFRELSHHRRNWFNRSRRDKEVPRSFNKRLVNAPHLETKVQKIKTDGINGTVNGLYRVEG